MGLQAGQNAAADLGEWELQPPRTEGLLRVGP